MRKLDVGTWTTSWVALVALWLSAALGTMARAAPAPAGAVADPFGDPRLQGVALADLDHPTARAVLAALELADPAHLDETLSVALVGGTGTFVVVDVVGRAGRFARLDAFGPSTPRERGGLGVVRLEVPIADAEGRSDVGPAKVRWERAFADMHPVLDVSLADQVAVLEDFALGFRRVWPIGIGAADAIRRPGRMASLTPTTDGGRLDKHEALPTLGGWNRGRPYLPLELPQYGRRKDGVWRRWFYETRVAFHAWPGQSFIRGFVSRGCVVLRDPELDELFAVVQALPDDLAFGIHAAQRPDVVHPLPYETARYWRLRDFGRPGHPELRIAGNLYVIEEIDGPPPDRQALVDIYSDGEARHVVALATARGCGPVPVGLRADDGDRCVPETALVTP